ncbi:hypothetical protein Tco_0272870 [Tanacetum coccineum]
MESVKKSIGERAQHKMKYESRVNERQIKTTEEKTDTSNALDALDASLVIIESNGTESKEPIYNEEPMAEVQMTAEINIFATGQQHTEQPEFNNEGEVNQNAEQYHDIRPLPAKLTDNMTIELSDQSLESKNAEGRLQLHTNTAIVKTVLNMDIQRTKEHIQSEKESIFLLLMGESLNVQDVKINLFWEFGKFTSRDENPHGGRITPLQPEWSRFVTLVKQLQKNWTPSLISGLFGHSQAVLKKTGNTENAFTAWDMGSMPKECRKAKAEDMDEEINELELEEIDSTLAKIRRSHLKIVLLRDALANLFANSI